MKEKKQKELKPFLPLVKFLNMLAENENIKIEWKRPPEKWEGIESWYVFKRENGKKKYLDKVEEIRKDLESMSIRKVALKYKCSTTTIQKIKKGDY